MVDRTDIDALLIGALYGELTPADEARLTAHLESHPADRTALADLEQARTAVRESRILEVQLDPPQAVSAILLQEAHRRAPRRAREAGEGWFTRFVRSFIAHPAMAAAAMLVVVVGVAGTMYLKHGASDLETETHNEETVAMQASGSSAAIAPTAPGAAPAAVEPPATPPVTQPVTPEAGSAMGVDLADKNVVGARGALAKGEAKPAASTPKPAPVAHEYKKHKVLAVETEQAMPKELDDRAKDAEQRNERFSSSVTGGGAAAATAPADDRPAAKTAAPAPAPPPPAPAQNLAFEGAKQAGKADTMLAWAKQQHEQAKSLTAKGDCVAAARVATDVSNRAPDYYQQFMENDRALKGCKPYIDRARDSEAEKQSKSRAQKRVNVPESDAVK